VALGSGQAINIVTVYSIYIGQAGTQESQKALNSLVNMITVAEKMEGGKKLLEENSESLK
jgi:hypothetical protein